MNPKKSRRVIINYLTKYAQTVIIWFVVLGAIELLNLFCGHFLEN